MNSVYFVVRMEFDYDGDPVEGSEEVLSVLTDKKVIKKAEEDSYKYVARVVDVIEDTAKRMRPTKSEFPAVRL